MAEETPPSKSRGKIVCQDGELEFDDPTVEDGFADMKAAILTGRTDIVRIILSAAQSYRDEEENYSEDDDDDEKEKLKLDEQEILDLLQMLLNFRDNDAGTGLHYATKLDHTDIVRSLLAAGANPTLKNLSNDTSYDYCHSDAMRTAYVGALMQAVAQSKTYRVKLLLQAGVDVNSGDGAESDNKILHWAASFASIDVIRILLDAGADVHATNADGSTALHDAVVRGDEEIVSELLNRGAKIDAVPFKGSLQGKNCYDLAESKQNIRRVMQTMMIPSNNMTENRLSSNEDTIESSATGSSSSSLLQASPYLVPFDDSTFKLVNGIDVKEESDLSPSPVKPTFKPMLVPPKSPMKLFFPTIVAVDAGVAQLWPPPQRVSQYKGTFYVAPLNLVIVLISSRNTTTACVSEFEKIIEIMKPKFKTTGFNVETDFTASYSTNYCCPKGSVECFIDPTTFHHCDEYRLQVSTRKVKIVASGIRSMFYALNTLLQCLSIFQGKGLPLLQISDWPDMIVRGVQMDFLQGDLPKLEIFLQFIDDLSSFKVNQLHLPAELFLPDDQNRLIFYSRRDLLRIHKHCKERYIELVPVLRSSELLGNYNTLSYACIKADILPLFPSTRYLSLSLNNVENSSKSKKQLLTGITDNDLVRRIEELHEFCVSNGLTLMLDSEIILQQPVKPLDINNNLICLNFSEETKKEAIPEHISDLGIPHLESPLYRGADTILNDIRASLKEFKSSILLAKKSNSLGMIVRYEAKPCLCCFSLDIAALALGSTMAWKSSADTMMDEKLLMGILNRHVYKDDNDVMGDVLSTLSSIEQYELLGKTNTQKELSSDNHVPVESSINRTSFLRSLLVSSDNIDSYPVSLETLKISTVSLKKLESRIVKCKMKCETRDMVINEILFIIKILMFLCRLTLKENKTSMICAFTKPLHKSKRIQKSFPTIRVGVVLQKARRENKEINLIDLTKTQRSDLSNKLMAMIESYESFCTSYYNETPLGLKSVDILKKLLTKLYPEQETSFFDSLTRTFTV